jgi:hypothetical protein
LIRQARYSSKKTTNPAKINAVSLHRARSTNKGDISTARGQNKMSMQKIKQWHPIFHTNPNSITNNNQRTDKKTSNTNTEFHHPRIQIRPYEQIARLMPWHWSWLLPSLRRRKRRKMWHNVRAEEAKDRIHRLPPPGNGTPRNRQLTITDFFTRMQMNDHAQLPHSECTELNTNTDQQIEIQNNKSPLKILQWNACSLNPEKRAQLELLLSKTAFDILCISELGRYRKIRGFPNYQCSNSDTQCAIFWRDGLNICKIAIEIGDKHERIMTQCISVNQELLLIHSYIAPELTHKARGNYWQDILRFI